MARNQRGNAGTVRQRHKEQVALVARKKDVGWTKEETAAADLDPRATDIAPMRNRPGAPRLGRVARRIPRRAGRRRSGGVNKCIRQLRLLDRDKGK
jgi:hypothetical protein